MQRRVLRRHICSSVRLYQTRALWLNERNLCPHSYTTWNIVHPSFLTRRMVGGGDPFLLKFWAKLAPLDQKRRRTARVEEIFFPTSSAVAIKGLLNVKYLWNLSTLLFSGIGTSTKWPLSFARFYKRIIQVRWETFTLLCGKFILDTAHQILSESSVL